MYKSLRMVNRVQFDAKIKKKSHDPSDKLQLTQAYFLSILTYFNARLRMDYSSMHDKKQVGFNYLDEFITFVNATFYA